jgi:antitoxin ChpS
MLHTTKLHKIGGSLMLEVPPAILECLTLSEGTLVEMAVERGCLVIRPVRRPTYSLGDLLAKCDAREESAIERAWVDAKPVGNELL